MHCHLVVSRKDQSNKIKISPLPNHRNTKKGTVKGGFDRINLFQQAEQGFDELFKHERLIAESFKYYNTMKNRTISEQIGLQGDMLTREKENKQVGLDADVQIGKDESINVNIDIGTSADLGLTSALSIFSPEIHGEYV